MNQVADEAGRIDVLVNIVGQGSWGLTEGFTTEQQKALFETNYFGAMRMDRAVIPHMRERDSGLLVHISTLAGRLVLPFMVPYAAAKHAIEAPGRGLPLRALALRYRVGDRRAPELPDAGLAAQNGPRQKTLGVWKPTETWRSARKRCSSRTTSS